MIDKIDPFPFHVNRMPYLDSNIASKIFHVSIGSEILSISRTTTHLTSIKAGLNLLFLQMKKQSSKITCIISLVKRIFGKHVQEYLKLGDTADEFSSPLCSYYYICVCIYLFVVYMCNLCLNVSCNGVFRRIV